MINCQTFQQNPESGPLNAAAQAHVASCAACARWRESQIAVSRLVGEMPRVNAPADFDFHLRARLARTQETRAGYGWLRVPVGATLAGLLAFGAWWNVSTANPSAATASRLASTGTMAQLPKPEVKDDSGPAIADKPKTSISVYSGPTKSIGRLIAVRQSRPHAQTSLPHKTRLPDNSGIPDSSALRSASTPSAGSEVISLPLSAVQSIKIELHNQRTGRRSFYVDALTFGREGLTRPASAGKTEAVIW